MKLISERTYLIEVPHQGGNITFQHPSFRGRYGNLAEQIDAEGLARPTSAQTASLIHRASKNPKGEYEAGILKILNNAWLVEFNGNLYLPKHEGEEVHNGVIIEANPTIQNGRLVMDRKALTERLKKGDPNVRFVPFGYAIGEQSIHTLAKNPYIIARYGEEGADQIVDIFSKYKRTVDKIADFVFKYKRNPCVWSFESVYSETARLSALCGVNWDFNGTWHRGDDWDDCIGRAFGVKK